MAENDIIADRFLFFRRAQHFLNRLAAHLKLMPEEISITSIVLPSEHPVKHGGFFNVYHGRYENSHGIQVEVALKVLKIFDQTDENRVILHRKFVREASTLLEA